MDPDIRKYIGGETVEDIVREVSADFGKRLAEIMKPSTKRKTYEHEHASKGAGRILPALP